MCFASLVSSVPSQKRKKMNKEETLMVRILNILQQTNLTCIEAITFNQAKYVFPGLIIDMKLL